MVSSAGQSIGSKTRLQPAKSTAKHTHMPPPATRCPAAIPERRAGLISLRRRAPAARDPLGTRMAAGPGALLAASLMPLLLTSDTGLTVAMLRNTWGAWAALGQQEQAQYSGWAIAAARLGSLHAHQHMRNVQFSSCARERVRVRARTSPLTRATSIGRAASGSTASASASCGSWVGKGVGHDASEVGRAAGGEGR